MMVITKTGRRLGAGVVKPKNILCTYSLSQFIHSNFIFRFCGTEANRLSKFRRMTVESTVIRWKFRCFRMINPKFGDTPTKQQQTGKFHGASACQNFHQRQTDSCAPKLRRFQKLAFSYFWTEIRERGVFNVPGQN
jgi:hypothetical protein